MVIRLTKKKKKKKVRFKVKGIILLILLFGLLVLSVYYLFTRKITNIYISGNYYLSDWEVIKLAKLDNYPSSIKNPSSLIENRLKKNILINNANVTKKHGNIVKINIDENRPLFFDSIKNKTILVNKKTTDIRYDVPILNSELSINMYNTLISKMSKVNMDVLLKMSEITYFKDEVDDERFYITMTDGNYVYVTLKKFTLINDYNNIVKEFNNKRGILYLNSGGYFKIMEN